ncbi:hypothetical protein PanWU01x14_194590 [Parasponia andersonii]|uniref:Uncharacterized protein n=1 Tax=Parasponia andersonii TaxID=3476 RepID=A0A2P5C0D0_PARAD|nr:hypothetical protein PanWU01x14_194590 [Parasponia andersonii]
MFMYEAKKAHKSVVAIEFQPPYPAWITLKPYPKDYVSPSFKKFNGKNDNAREHIISFLDDLGVYASDHELYLRNFFNLLPIELSHGSSTYALPFEKN